MFEFNVNLTNAENGHVCVIGPTAHGMTPSNLPGEKVNVCPDELGWSAKTVVLSQEIIGRGKTQELALYELNEKVDAVFWQVHELRDEIARMASEAMINDQ